MASQFVNRLVREKSPCILIFPFSSPDLLQHAHNPVDWYPWGKEAFQAARDRKVPVFLSVGYSTCQYLISYISWCHVMERESFENKEIADLLNDCFVKEELPTVDKMYMSFVQATTGHGGWPMSVWLTPSLEPFYGGTYFSPKAKYGNPGFIEIIRMIDQLYRTSYSGGRAILTRLPKAQSLSPSSLTVCTDETCSFDANAMSSWKAARKLYAAYEHQFDAKEGAPKFPTPVIMQFLLFYHRAMNLSPEKPIASLSDQDIESLVTKNALTEVVGQDDPRQVLQKLQDESKMALYMVEFTLNKISRGGIHDHIGAGFHRYSVDGRWHVPQ